MVLLEAMEAGVVPVASTETGAAADVVTDGMDGFLLSDLSVSGLEMAMRNCVSLKAKLAHLGAKARLRAAAYDAKEGARQYVQYSLEALGLEPAAPLNLVPRMGVDGPHSL